MALEAPVPETVALPCKAADDMLQVRVAESTSTACSVRANTVGVPFSVIVTVVEVPSVITGASLTAVTVKRKVSLVVPVPSLTVTVIVVVPF